MDIISKSKRSEVMSKIKSKNTTPEMLLKDGIDSRYLKYQPVGIFGNPDFANKSVKLAIFIDGCFWHGCPQCYRKPKSNKRYWNEKIRRNRKRDVLVNKTLRKNNWIVLRLWECSIRKNTEGALRRIYNQIKALIANNKNR